MRLISRHILKSLAAPFFWGLAALTGLLLLQYLAPLIERFGGKGLGLNVMLEAILLTIPAVLTLTLPMGVLVAALYGYSQLAADLEMVAMYANGLSVWRMARPALIAAACVACADFFLFDQIVPRSNILYANLANDVINTRPALTLQPQSLNRLAGTSYVLRADQIAQDSGRLKVVTIYDMTSYESQRVIYADSGLMEQSPNKKDLIMTLQQGQVVEFRHSEPGRMQRTSFRTNRIVIRDVAGTLIRTRNERGEGDREKSSCELLDGITEAHYRRTEAERFSDYYARRDLRTLARLSIPSQPAVKPMPKFQKHCGQYRVLEKWVEGIMLPTRAEAQAPAQQPPAQQPPVQQPVQQPPVQQPPVTQGATPPGPDVPAPFLVPPRLSLSPTPDGITTLSEITASQFNVRSQRTQELKFGVEYHKKIAIPLSSLCFVLLGMSLALKYPRSGIGLVIGASLVIFLGFYILLIGGSNVAERGYLSPLVAIQAPLVLFSFFGLLAVNSANREMGTARTAGVLEALRNLVFRARGGRE